MNTINWQKNIVILIIELIECTSFYQVIPKPYDFSSRGTAKAAVSWHWKSW